MPYNYVRGMYDTCDLEHNVLSSMYILKDTQTLQLMDAHGFPTTGNTTYPLE